MHYHLEAEIAELKASLELALGRWRESQDRIMQLTQDRDTLKQALDVAVNGLNYYIEFFNGDGNSYQARQALTSINEIINQTKQSSMKNDLEQGVKK